MPPPALLLHGFLGRGADWTPVAARLASSRRILAPDLPGHGAARSDDRATRSQDAATHLGHDARRSDDAEPFDAPVPRPGGLAWAADRLAAHLDAAGVAVADVAGYSMGGRLALMLAVRHPARVRRLALLSVSPGLAAPQERAARRAADAALAGEIVADFPAFLDRWTRQPLFATLSDAQRAALVAERLAHGRPAALAAALAAMGTGAMAPLWEPLRTLGVEAHAGRGVETHAVAGALDAKFVALARAMDPPARVHVLAGAGHNLLAEAPAALGRLLLHLLD